MNHNVIINADVMDGLRQLPDGCVQTCITSPPYWGLRDYGTADWQGGDEKCDHLGPTIMSEKTGLSHPELKTREKLFEAKKEGKAILLFSKDLDEILMMSDRIAPIYEGVLSEPVPFDKTSKMEIGAAIIGK